MTDVVLIHTSTEDAHAREVAKCLDRIHAKYCVLARERCFVD